MWFSLSFSSSLAHSRVSFSLIFTLSRVSLSLSHFHMICTARSTYVRGDYEGEWWCIGAVRTRRTPPLWAPYRAITRLLTITEYLLAARFHFDIRPLPHFVFSSSILALSSVSLSLASILFSTEEDRSFLCEHIDIFHKLHIRIER